ncbi:hypothetical protein [Actinocrinis puniceicyclus]|uniref:hypothetical protein n=1 Tax=Actinocrinis puniceicyclus TaxID=977794 RepID=UPI001B8D205F|nr:hypothetical protein [Actinocrinis puniceicyclus]
MDLAVQVFIDREDGRRDLFDPPTEAAGSAGFDSWRETVWGSPRARSLGARLLPRLAEADLLVEPARLHDLLEECALLRDRLETLIPGMDALDPHAPGYYVNTGSHVRIESAEAVAHFRHTVAQRLANIESAAMYALVVGGGVAISTAARAAEPAPDAPVEPTVPSPCAPCACAPGSCADPQPDADDTEP